MELQTLLDKKLLSGLEAGCFPGAVAACGCKKEVLALSAVGKIALDGPDANRQTRYDMASLTKVLAPTMIAFQAIQDGLITLYDTLESWFEDVPEDKKQITVFQLMTHTAGFTPSFRLDKTIKDPVETLKAILASELISRPGEKPNYSCMGYITLGKLLEKAYGQKLNVLAKKLVFDPLGMKQTGYLPEGGNIAATEVDPVTHVAWQGVVHDENARFQGGVSANAGVFSCIDDMITFAGMLSSGGEGYIAPSLLKRRRATIRPALTSTGASASIWRARSSTSWATCSRSAPSGTRALRARLWPSIPRRDFS